MQRFRAALAFDAVHLDLPGIKESNVDPSDLVAKVSAVARGLWSVGFLARRQGRVFEMDMCRRVVESHLSSTSVRVCAEAFACANLLPPSLHTSTITHTCLFDKHW